MSYGTSVTLNLTFADTGRPELKPVADEVARRLAGALAALTS